MGTKLRGEMGKASLLFLLAFPGCAGFPWSGAGEKVVLTSSLSPRAGAWTAATVLGLETSAAGGSVPAPLVEDGPGSYLMEVRARPGRLYRFRKGGRFRDLAWTPLLDPGANPSLDRLLSSLGPQPVPAPSWEPAPAGPFPSFYDAYLEIRVSPGAAGGCRIALDWKDRPGENLGERAREHLVRALTILEPLARGNERLRRGDPVGALGAYDRALAAGRPPCCAYHARCLGRVQFNRALCLARLGDLDGAFFALKRASALAPDLPGLGPMKRTLAGLLGGKDGGASGKNPPGNLLEKGRRLLAAGRLREALRVFQVAQCRPALTLGALQGRAEAESRLGRLWEAREHLLQALERSPENPSLLASLARLARREGKGPQALYWALPLGRNTALFRGILASLPALKTAPYLALLGEKPPALPPTPLARALAAAGKKDPSLLRRIPHGSGAGETPASPPK